MIAVHVLNGPDLNRLGRREPDVDGCPASAERESGPLGFDAGLGRLLDRA